FSKLQNKYVLPDYDELQYLLSYWLKIQPWFSQGNYCTLALPSLVFDTAFLPYKHAEYPLNVLNAHPWKTSDIPH
ncbi:MAG TPA: hypothetical protein P5522_09650, partial [Spirochaetia bacterium]|nr:hypothetical protein [Spirochaetia bacterium]